MSEWISVRTREGVAYLHSHSLTYPVTLCLCHSHSLQATAPFRMSVYPATQPLSLLQPAIQPTNQSIASDYITILTRSLLADRPPIHHLLSTTQPPPYTTHHYPLSCDRKPPRVSFLPWSTEHTEHIRSGRGEENQKEPIRTSCSSCSNLACWSPCPLSLCPLVPCSLVPSSMFLAPPPSLFSSTSFLFPHPHIHSKFTLQFTPNSLTHSPLSHNTHHPPHPPHQDNTHRNVTSRHRITSRIA